MKAGWIQRKLRDVCTLINGRAYSKSELLAQGKYPVLRVGNFFTSDHWYYSDMELDADKYCQSGDLLYAWSASFGPRIWVGEKVIFHYHIWKVLPKPDLANKKFLYFWFLWDKEHIKQDQGTGTTMIHVSKGSMEDRNILLPPTPEQWRIVRILDEAFEGIATAKANAEKNLQNARALFESRLQSVLAQRGAGWAVARIGEVCTLRSGTTVSASLERAAGDLPYLKVADMSYAGNEVEIVSSSRFLGRSDIGINTILPPGTTIFPKRGGAILTNKKRLTAVPICADLNIMGVIPSKELLPKYLYFYFLTVDMRKIGSGSSIPQINNYDIEPLAISFPSTAQQQEIVRSLDELSIQTNRLAAIYEKKLAALDALKKSLLHQAFTGQL